MHAQREDDVRHSSHPVDASTQGLLLTIWLFVRGFNSTQVRDSRVWRLRVYEMKE
jgi:hypothetical protein